MATNLGKVGMVMKGTYNSANTYEVLDVVTYNDGLYVAKQAVPAGTLPTDTTYWQAAFDNNAVEAQNTNTIDTWKSTGVTTAYGGLVKVGRMHILNGRWTGSLTGNTAEILTVPAKYRPASTFYGNSVIDRSGWAVGSCTLGSDGILRDITTSSTKTSGTFSIAWYV